MNNFFTICSVFYSILLTILYFKKPRVVTLETKIYSWLVLFNLLTTVVATSCYYTIMYREYIPILNFIISKTLIVLYFVWTTMFTVYVYIISSKKEINLSSIKEKEKIGSLVLLIYNIAIIGLIYILPLYYPDDNIIYSYGPSANIVYIICGIYMFFWAIRLIYNYKNLKNKKNLPVIIFMLFMLVSMIVQKLIPGLLLITATETFVTFLMYFTIENPDVKMINSLNLAKDTAEKANRAKSDFLSSMSHEIRTPLNAIVGFSECIINADSLEEAKENASDIVSASKTLLEIVNGILDISKIEAGKLELVESDYSSKKLFNDVIKLIQARIGDKPLEFKVSIAEDLPPVLYGDQMNVKKILINLLTNAVKYTDQGFVSLDVKCVQTDNVCRLIISVKDSGRGIKQEDIGKLFTKFQRVDEDRNTTVEGTGLGLAITKQLVDMMNGKILVNSVYNEGSEFKVAIDQRLSKEKIEEEKEEVDEFNLDLTNKKILIVDDNKLNLKVAQKLLVKYNPIITTAESGMECLNLINSGHRYDLILLDDMMPKMRGTEVLMRLKKIENFNTPVIALTANAINGMKEQYLKDGFDDYLAKPIEKPELYRILRKYITSDKVVNEESPKEAQNTVSQNTILQNEIKEIGISFKDYSDKKVLIVDDNKVNITIAINFLKPYNFIIESCLSGMECLNLINSGKTYDLMFVDIMMPEMDGVELLNKLKLFPNFKTPVIALTADAVEGAKEKYLSCGFDGYIAKPIDKNELNNLINKFLNTNTTKRNIDYLKENEVDIDKSLELLGDINTYNDLVKEFIGTIKDKINDLNRYKNQNDLANYAILVHSLKSDSRYLGFNRLADIALQHELKSKENDITYIQNNFNLLLNEVKKIIDIMNQYMN